MQHIQGQPALLSGHFQSKLNDETGVLSSGEGNIDPLKSVKNLLKPQPRRGKHIHTQETFHTVCSTSFRMVP